MEETNCLGIEILDSVVIELVLDGSVRDDIELQIEPSIVMHGDGRMTPGVTYNPEFYTVNLPGFIGETIAYLINEGPFTDGSIEDEPTVTWNVRADSLPVLIKHGIIK